MRLILSERYMEKNGQTSELSDDICYSSLYFYCLKQMIGWGYEEAKPPCGMISGVFLEFHYLRVSINTLLCNPNLRYSESIFSYFYRRR